MALAVTLLAINLAALAASVIYLPGSALPWIFASLLTGPLYLLYKQRERIRQARRRPPPPIYHWRDRGKVIPFPASRQSRPYR